MTSVEARFDAFATGFAWLAAIDLFFLAVIIGECVWDYASGRRRKLAETLANFAIAGVNLLLDRTAYGLIFVIALLLVEPYAPLHLPLTGWSWALAILVADFTYYWMHRAEHQLRVFWAYHSVHHSSPEYNLTTALRLAWLDGAIEWLFFLPMVLLGFDVVQTVMAISIVVAYQTWIHTEKVGQLGWLDGILNTPSVHRVHHGVNAAYIDKNFGGILIIWDRLFGTYQAETEPVRYGVLPQLGSANPLVINGAPWLKLLADLCRARNMRNILLYLLGRPGWRPDTAKSDAA
jgi:sterol desaturase/sphingolipid hydroxylase (fatty acid hydroxylase superfamily)